jgi:hypothetical protein
MSIVKILHGHTSRETAYEVKDYPYGRLRTSMFFWVESVPGKGDRVCRMTINPKNGRENKPHKTIYYTFMFLYLDGINHVQDSAITFYEMKEAPERFEFLFNEVGIEQISETQQKNLRHTFISFFIADSFYESRHYTQETRPLFDKWSTDRVTYMANCSFADIMKFPEPQPPRTIPDKDAMVA